MNKKMGSFYLSENLKTVFLVTAAEVENSWAGDCFQVNPSSMFLPEEWPLRHVRHSLYISIHRKPRYRNIMGNIFRIGEYKFMTEYVKTWLVGEVAFVFSILANFERGKHW